MTYSQLMIIVCAAMGLNAVRYVYIGFIKAPRMIIRWKELKNEVAVSKWQKYMKQCRTWSAPLSVAGSLLAFLLYMLDKWQIYLQNISQK